MNSEMGESLLIDVNEVEQKKTNGGPLIKKSDKSEWKNFKIF